MAAIVYPSTLPTPSVSAVTPGDRRTLSDLAGPFQTRGNQRDYVGVQQVSWNLLTPTEAGILNDWWRDDLLEGGAWFTSTWPVPQGWVSLVRRFQGVPEWSYNSGAGHWKVSAVMQVRGRGMAPQGA